MSVAIALKMVKRCKKQQYHKIDRNAPNSCLICSTFNGIPFAEWYEMTIVNIILTS